MSEVANEVQANELDQVRADIAAEIFSNEPIALTPTKEVEPAKPSEPKQEVVDPKTADPEPTKDPEPDPWEGVSPIVRERFESLEQQITGVETVGHRLKQAESRIGSIQNEMYAAKQAAKEAGDAPSQTEMAAAFKDSEKWGELKEDYPEWAELLDGMAEVLAGVPVASGQSAGIGEDQIKEIRESLQTDFNKQLTSQQEAFELKLIDFAHKDWRTTINSPEFGEWLKTQDAAYQQEVLSSNDSTVVISTLDKFRDHQKPSGTQESAEEIAAQRQARLEASTTPTVQSKKPPKPKSEADMTVEELRAKIASEVFSEE